MKKKLYITILCAVLLVLPSVIAIISYINAQNNPVTEHSVSSVSVIMPDGKKIERNKSDDNGSELIECFVSLSDDAVEVKGLPNTESTYKKYEVVYECYNKKHTYKYFMSQSDSNAYYLDDNDTYYRISSESAGKFLTSDYGICLYESSSHPAITIGNTSGVLPISEKWKYRGYGNKMYDSKAVISSEVLSCDVSGGLQISFDRTPDNITVTMKNTSGDIVFDGFYEDISQSLFDNNTVYDVTVVAKWYEAEERDFCGEQTYHFKANVLSPAEFYLNTSSVEYGQFFIVSAKNIVDPSQIGFSSTPSINFDPAFFEYGGMYHALVPISLDCMSANDNAKQYSFTLSYGGVVRQLNIDIKDRDLGAAYITTSAETLNSLRSTTSLREFDDIMKQPLSSRINTIYWINDNHVIPPVASNSIKFGFSMKMVLQNLSGAPSYLHEGVDFNTKSGEIVQACLPGQVIYVGETTLSGKTVIIDHGAGLKSMYAHLNSINCNIGDIMQKGATVGIVGSTGLCYKKPTVHFGLYVFDVPIRYYDYETDGINLASYVNEILNKH